MEKITKAFSADITIEDGERAVIARVSTRAVDREGDVLIPAGCRTADYEKNPVVFLNHNYWTLPVGRCAALRKTDDAIIAKTVFAERPADFPADQEWMPDTLLALFKQGVLRAFSVGFLPIESRPASKKDIEEHGDNCRRVFNKWNMMEYSVACIPANQEAVATAVAKGIVSDATAKALGMSQAEIEPEDEEEECECENPEPDDKGNCKGCGKPIEDNPGPRQLTIYTPTQRKTLVYVAGISAPDIDRHSLKRRGVIYI